MSEGRRWTIYKQCHSPARAALTKRAWNLIIDGPETDEPVEVVEAAPRDRELEEAERQANELRDERDRLSEQLERADSLLRQIRDGKHSLPGTMVQIDRYFERHGKGLKA